MSSVPSGDGALPLARYRLHLEASGNIRLPAYAGSAWRGVFGHALRRAVCVTREPVCPPCLLYRSCAYPYIFETPPPPDGARMRRYPAAPHPYVIEPWADVRSVPSGTPLGLDLVLFGRGNASLGYIVHAFAQAGDRGIGAGTYRLCAVEQQVGTHGWDPIYRPGDPLTPHPPAMPVVAPLPDWVEVRLQTPLRITHNNRLVRPQSLGFADFFGSLLRRVASLAWFHGTAPLEADFRALRDAAKGVSFHSSQLRWRDGARYSSRQDRTVPLGGIVGQFVLDGGALEPFWPYLWLGQWTHVGKAAVMGLGRYEMVLGPAPDTPGTVSGT